MALAAGAGIAGKGSFWASNAGQAVASTGMSMAAGAGAGLLSGWTSKKQQKRAHKYNLEYMEKQFQQSKEAAAINQKYAKDMYDYTSYENERRHMENANLNPALIYGMGGAAGGSASGGGQVSGGSQPSTNPVNAGGQYGQMSINAMALMSEIAKNNAQANKDNAEADKKRGVDTEEAKSRIELNNSMKAVQNEMVNLTAANYFKTLKEQDLIWQKARLLASEAEVSESVIDAKIEQVYQQNLLNTLTGFEKLAKINLDNESAKKIAEETRWIAFDMQTRRITANAAKERVEVMVKELEKKYKFQDQENIRQWIFGSIDALAKGANAVSNFIPVGRVIKMGEKVLEETFNGKGQSKGWKEVTKEIINEVK